MIWSLFRRDLDVVDIPELFLPNANLPAVSHALTKENAFLLLQWIRYLKKQRKLPDAFIYSISEGK
jgi:sacsin